MEKSIDRTEKTSTRYLVTDDGIKILHRATRSNIAHLAFIFNVGSRDELPYEHGMAHFIEHCLFKGTSSRRSSQVLSRLENVGGEMNAFTTKENICLHASFMPEYLDRAVELFASITFDSVYPAAELEKEKGVITDEINSYLEAPDELIFEQGEELLYPTSPLGRTILGTPESISRFTREDVLAFWDRNFSREDMIICVSGDYDADKVMAVIKKRLAPYMDYICKSREQRQRVCPVVTPAIKKEQVMDTYQRHVILLSRAYPYEDSLDYRTMVLLNNMLGGPSMTSMLNMSLRERHALVYNVESFYTAYGDVGTAGIYIATEEDSYKKALTLTYKILDKLSSSPISERALATARRQLLGQMAIASENELNQLISLGKIYMGRGRCDSYEEMRKKIESITTDDIMRVAREVYNPDNITMLTFKSDKK
jgi:predicted Zn-dependent peptidase